MSKTRPNNIAYTADYLSFSATQYWCHYIGDCENFSFQIGHNLRAVVLNAVIKKTSQKIITRIK